VPAAGLASPIIRKHKFGSWTATWTQTEYADKSQVFSASSDQTIDVYMETKAVHVWKPSTTVAYTTTTDTLVMNSILTRDGINVQNATSCTVNGSNVGSYDLFQYTLRNMTDDVESLRKNLLGNQSIGVIGHSTGAHQVFDYAIRFPDQVFGIISLHGGASGLGFLTQTYYRLIELQKAFAGIDSGQIAQLRQLIQSGGACDQDGNKLPSSAWQQLTNFALYGTVSQRKELSNIFKSLIGGNLAPKTFCSSVNGNKESKALMPQIPSNDPLNAMAGINPIINQNVICSNFVTKDAVAVLPAPFHDPTYNYICIFF
jgi:pimeloyl-ACP methyl ester carboxylesterase